MKMKYFPVIFVIVTNYHLVSLALPRDDINEEDVLKCEVLQYDLDIMELNKDTFSGKLHILLECNNTVKNIKLVAPEHMKLKSCEISNYENYDCTFTRSEQFFVLEFKPELSEKNVIVNIIYISSYNDYDKGLYVDDTGNGKIYYSKGKNVLFPHINDTNHKNVATKIKDRVGRNKILSNFPDNEYLHQEEIALVIAPIQNAGSKDNILIYKMITESNPEEALEFSYKIYEILAFIFNELPSQVIQVGLPIFSAREFQAKGFIIHSDRNFYGIDTECASQTQSFFISIGHHLLHQWFGIKRAAKNAWIDEGLKTLLSNMIIDEYLSLEVPKYKTLDQFVVDHVQSRAFEVDGFLTSRALDENPDDVTYEYEHQDPIRSSKGASVMKFFMHICGLYRFNSILLNYLEHNENNLELIQFLKSCIRNNKADEFISKLRGKPGYPVIHVMDKKTKGERSFELMQERFLWQEEQENKELWCLPITYTTSEGKILRISQIEWFCEKKFDLNVNGDVKWIVLNNELQGFYRVNYPARIWEAIKTELKHNHTNIHEINRAQIIDDMFSFARSTFKFSSETPDYAMALNMTGYLANETNYLPLKAAFNSFSFLDTALYGEKPHENFRSHIRNIVEKLYQTFGLTSGKSKHLDILTSKLVSHWACKLEIEKCIKDAESLIISPVDNPNPNVVEIALCSVMRNSKESDKWMKWENYFDIYRKENNTNVKLFYINFLGCSKVEKNINVLLNEILEPKSRRFSMDIIDSVLKAGPENGGTVVKFLESRRTDIIKTLGTETVGRILFRLSAAANAEDAQKLLEIFKNLQEDETVKTAKAKLKSINSWKDKKMSVIAKYYSLGNSAENCKLLPVLLLFSVIVPIVKNFI